MRIKEWWNAKSTDKKLHFGICAVLTLGLSFMIRYELAILIVLVIGLGKEVKDYVQKGKFSVADLNADITGIVVGVVAYTVIGSLIEMIKTI